MVPSPVIASPGTMEMVWIAQVGGLWRKCSDTYFKSFSKVMEPQRVCNINYLFSYFVTVDTCPLPAIPSNGSRSQNTFVFSDVIVFTCNNGYRLVGENATVCLAGGVANAAAPLCQNINECVKAPPCSRDALCVDLHGSFGCECIAGYTGNGFLCTGEYHFWSNSNSHMTQS